MFNAMLLIGALAGPATAADYEPADFLPLTVGNSWTFEHWLYDDHNQRHGPKSQWPAFAALSSRGSAEFTIRVEGTEVLAGQTYYVLSDMPTGWAPAPPHFLAGKKLRWEGAWLMEHTGAGEHSLYRFDSPDPYTIPTTEGDNEAQRFGGHTYDGYPVPEYTFWFYGYDYEAERNAAPPYDPYGLGGWANDEEDWSPGRAVSFLAGYGIGDCAEWINASDYGFYHNDITPLHAVLVDGAVGGSASGDGGVRKVSYRDVYWGRDGATTSASPSSWGQVKGSSSSP